MAAEVKGPNAQQAPPPSSGEADGSKEIAVTVGARLVSGVGSRIGADGPTNSLLTLR
jgi:hypothetical protein